MVDTCDENNPSIPVPLPTLTTPVIFSPYQAMKHSGKMVKMGNEVRNLSLNPDYATYYMTLDKVYNFSETHFPPV